MFKIYSLLAFFQLFHKCENLSVIAKTKRFSTSKMSFSTHTYRIAGKFGEGFNLAIWRICGEIAKLKPRQLS